MRISSKITILVCMTMLLASCQRATGSEKLVQADLPRVEVSALNEVQAALLKNGNNAFAFDLYQKISQQETENLIFSPYSIWMAFSMVYAGARGETESQMTNVFHFLGQDIQHVSLNAMDQQLQDVEVKKSAEGEDEGEDDGTPFQLNLANAVWSQQGYAFNQAYLDMLATQYGAGLRVVDFQGGSETAREAINAWVGENTDGKIKEIAGPGSITPDTRLVLTNAILFTASWMYQFNQAATADGQFTLLDGSAVTTPLMHVGAPLDYLEKDYYQAVRLPYVGYKTEMWIILPAVGQWEAVQSDLGPGFMNDIQQATMAHVTLTLPSYDFESELSLNDLLVSMGMTKAFCPAGDYSGISEGGGLCIGQAVHKAMIKVDEEGTEAAAVTMVAMPASIMEEVVMKVDRPFIFAIISRESGLILFLGQVLNPAAN